MNRGILTFFAILFSSVLNVTAVPPANVSDAYAQGNQAYAAGDFIEAIAAYNQALEHGQSANLHFNLANAHAEMGSWGRAILHYHKALALEPHHADARTNLYLSRQRAGLDAEEPGFWQRWAENLPLTVWIVAASIAFWLLLAVWILWDRRRFPAPRLRALLTIICAAVLCATAPALYGYHLAGQKGVVLADEAVLRVAPISQSPGSATITSGETARIQRTVKGFYLVELPSGEDGYLAPDEFSPVWDSAPRPSQTR